MVQWVVTNRAEFGVDFTRTKHVIRTAIFCILSFIIGRTKLDEMSNYEIRQECNIMSGILRNSVKNLQL